MSFDIIIRHDGVISRFGNRYSISIDEAVEELYQYDAINEYYTEYDILNALNGIREGDYRIFNRGNFIEYQVKKLLNNKL